MLSLKFKSSAPVSDLYNEYVKLQKIVNRIGGEAVEHPHWLILKDLEKW